MARTGEGGFAGTTGAATTGAGWTAYDGAGADVGGALVGSSFVSTVTPMTAINAKAASTSMGAMSFELLLRPRAREEVRAGARRGERGRYAVMESRIGQGLDEGVQGILRPAVSGAWCLFDRHGLHDRPVPLHHELGVLRERSGTAVGVPEVRDHQSLLFRVRSGPERHEGIPIDDAVWGAA